MKAAQAETGAALMGRRFFDIAPDPDVHADGCEFQVPIVVVTHRPPQRQPKRNDQLFSTFVTEGPRPPSVRRSSWPVTRR
jgi:dihydrofolate reductase